MLLSLLPSLVASLWLTASPQGSLYLIDAPAGPDAVSLSSDGRAAWLGSGPQGRTLYLGSVDDIGVGGQARMALGSAQVHGLSWIGEDWLLHTSEPGVGHVLWIDGPAGPRQALVVPRERELAVLGTDPRGRPLVAHDARQAHAPDVYSLDLARSAARLVEYNPGRIVAWLADAEGQIRAARRWRPAGHSLRYELLFRTSPASAFRSVWSHDLTEPALRPLGFSPDGRSIYVESEGPGGEVGLHRLDPVSGQLGPALASQLQSAVARIRHDRVTGRLALVDFATDRTRRFLLEASWTARLAPLSHRFPDHTLDLAGYNPEGEALWRVSAPQQAPRYTWMDADGDLRGVGRDHPAPGAAAQAFTFQARDGLPLSGYLTTRARGPQPTIVRVHGGPWARDQWQYDPEVQFLASLGYAVLQVNFRGSRGLGHGLLMAGRGQWGQRMQDDLLDAVAWAAGAGLVDADRVCIMGASYGGYAALMGVLRDPKVFRCAVAHAPVSDLATHIESYRRNGHRRAFLEWRVMVGDPRSDRQALEAVSPLTLASGLSRPVLVSLGALDQAVDPAQGHAFVRRAGPDRVELLEFSDEGHTLMRVDNRRHYYARVANFLETHLAPGRP